MLDVDRRVDVDAGAEQLLHVEISLGMAAPGSIRVCELVDQHQLGPALQDRVEIHLLEDASLVLRAAARDDLQALDERKGLGAPVRLDDADDDVDALAFARTGAEQHLVRLADARRCAEKNLEAAPPFLAAGRLQERLRRGALIEIASLFRHGLSRFAVASAAL